MRLAVRPGYEQASVVATLASATGASSDADAWIERASPPSIPKRYIGKVCPSHPFPSLLTLELNISWGST